MHKSILKRFGAAVLALFLTACGESERPQPAPQTSSQPAESQAQEPAEPVTLTVYLEALYTQEGVHYPLYEALKEYDEAHPEIELEFVSPVGGANDPAKREEEIHQLNTEIITGGGPDVFIMGTFRYTDSNLFPDVAKAMGNHAFLPLNAYAQAAASSAMIISSPHWKQGSWRGNSISCR